MGLAHAHAQFGVGTTKGSQGVVAHRQDPAARDRGTPGRASECAFRLLRILELRSNRFRTPQGRSARPPRVPLAGTGTASTELPLPRPHTPFHCPSATISFNALPGSRGRTARRSQSALCTGRASAIGAPILVVLFWATRPRKFCSRASGSRPAGNSRDRGRAARCRRTDTIVLPTEDLVLRGPC
jgi:hypothetical protein